MNVNTFIKACYNCRFINTALHSWTPNVNLAVLGQVKGTLPCVVCALLPEGSLPLQFLHSAWCSHCRRVRHWQHHWPQHELGGASLSYSPASEKEFIFLKTYLKNFYRKVYSRSWSSNLCGADDGLANPHAPASHHLLSNEDLLCWDFNAEISTGNHDAITSLQDLIKSVTQ